MQNACKTPFRTWHYFLFIAQSGLSLIGCKMKISKPLLKMHSKPQKCLKKGLCLSVPFSCWYLNESRNTSRWNRNIGKALKSPSALFFCYSSEFYSSVKAHNSLSSLGFLIFKKQLLCYNVLWTGLGWTVPSDTRCSYMKSFEGFAALQKKQKLCSLGIKLQRCKSFVCSRLKIMDYQKKEGKILVKDFCKGKQLKAEYKQVLFVVWSQYWRYSQGLSAIQTDLRCLLHSGTTDKLLWWHN